MELFLSKAKKKAIKELDKVGEAKAAQAFKDSMAELKSHVRGIFEIFPRLVTETKSEMDKDIGVVNCDVGKKHFKEGALTTALLRFKLALWFNSTLIEPHYYIGRCYFLQGRFNKANKAFQKTLSLDPHHEEASFMLKRQTSPEEIRTIPHTYMSEIFDRLAPIYEAHYVPETGYSAHEATITNIEPKLIHAAHTGMEAIQVLDLGCGTGLCGQRIYETSPICVIDGVDLSSSMLEKAHTRMVASRKVYRLLECHDAYLFLTQMKKKYDVIIAAGLIDYLGDLSLLFEQIAAHLTPNGHVVITHTKHPEDEPTAYLYHSYADGFAHKTTHIEALAHAAGLMLSDRLPLNVYHAVKGYCLSFKQRA